MINIQLHGVTAWQWLPKDDEDKPDVLSITTLDGVQEVTLFPARPIEARKPKAKRRRQPEEKGGEDDEAS